MQFNVFYCMHLQRIEIIYIHLWVFFFQTSGPENRVNTKDFKDADWLFPETTKNFTKLPLQYRVIKFFITSIIGQKHLGDTIKACNKCGMVTGFYIIIEDKNIHVYSCFVLMHI